MGGVLRAVLQGPGRGGDDVARFRRRPDEFHQVAYAAGEVAGFGKAAVRCLRALIDGILQQHAVG